MTALLSPNAKQQFFDDAGNPAASYRLYTYAANTTTPQATFTNRAGTVANTNPIILDARGEATIYLTPGVVYDYVLKTASDVTVWTREDVEADPLATDLASSASGRGAELVNFANGIPLPSDPLTSQARVAFNPTGITGWTDNAKAENYEGLLFEVGDYGPRSFGAGTVSALTGAVKIPSTSTLSNHGQGLGGYARTSSATTAALGVFGEARCDAASTIAFGGNFVANDDGFGSVNLWGLEVDVNVNNPGSTVRGIDVTGGSNFEPSLSVAYRVGALGAFTTPKKRWQEGLSIEDGACVTAIQVGASAEVANSGTTPIIGRRRNAANVREDTYKISTDGDGNFTLEGLAAGALFTVKAAGASPSNLVLNGGNTGVGLGGVPSYPLHVGGHAKFNAGVGFFNTNPVTAKPTVTGSKGGNVALDSLLIELANLGLITNSTT